MRSFASTDIGIKFSIIEVHNEKGEKNTIAFIPASRLRLNAGIMKHKPKTENQIKLKRILNCGIRKGKLKDFWRPVCDPSFNKSDKEMFVERMMLEHKDETEITMVWMNVYPDVVVDEDSTGIMFELGKKPALHKSYDWWENRADNYMPEWESHLGTKYQYAAFLAELIRLLVASGCEMDDAWYMVCDDSAELGNYLKIMVTGCWEIFGLFDLAGNAKILRKDENGHCFYLASGSYLNSSKACPLATMDENYCFETAEGTPKVGWVVYERNPQM